VLEFPGSLLRTSFFIPSRTERRSSPRDCHPLTCAALPYLLPPRCLGSFLSPNLISLSTLGFLAFFNDRKGPPFPSCTRITFLTRTTPLPRLPGVFTRGESQDPALDLSSSLFNHFSGPLTALISLGTLNLSSSGPAKTGLLPPTFLLWLFP